MADQDIEFKVTANVDDANKGFDEVQQKINGMKGSASETIPVMDEVTETMEDVGSESSIASDVVASLGFALGVTLVGGVLIAIPLLIDLWKEIATAKEEMENFAEAMETSVKKLLEFQDPSKGVKYALTPEQMKDQIAQVQKEVDLINAIRRDPLTRSGVSPQSVTFYQTKLTEEQEKDLISKEALLEIMKEIQTQYEADVRMQGELKRLGFEQVIDEEEVNTKLKERKRILEEINEIVITGGNAANRWAKSMQVDVSGRNKGGRGKVKGGKEEAGMTQQFAEDMEFMNQLIMSSAGILRSEFMKAWEDIFGEANSLFEKFIANMIEQLANLAAKNLMGSILNLLVPGLGTAAGMALGDSSVKNPTQINLQMDNQTMATWYVGGKTQANRLRIN
jgi:hypothetical protein